MRVASPLRSQIHGCTMWPSAGACTVNRVSAAALLLVLLGAAACGEDAEHPVMPVSPSAPSIDWGWPSAAASGGRSRFQLQTILRTGPYEAGGGPTLQVQGQVETDEPDLVLSDLYGKLRVVADDGMERVLEREHSNVDAASRNVTFFGIDAGPSPKRLRSLEVELRIVHVKRWTTRTVADVQLGEPQRIVLPPFEFSVTAEETGVVVSAYSTDETLAGHEREWNLLSHRWAAAAADVVGASGARLRATGGGGSGGFTSQTYMSPFDAAADVQVAYPATVTLRVPATWEDEIVRYRFTDLDLAEVPHAR